MPRWHELTMHWRQYFRNVAILMYRKLVNIFCWLFSIHTLALVAYVYILWTPRFLPSALILTCKISVPKWTQMAIYPTSMMYSPHALGIYEVTRCPLSILFPSTFTWCYMWPRKTASKQEILHQLQHVKIVNCRNKLDNQHVCYDVEGGLRIGGPCF